MLCLFYELLVGKLFLVLPSCSLSTWVKFWIQSVLKSPGSLIQTVEKPSLVFMLKWWRNSSNSGWLCPLVIHLERTFYIILIILLNFLILHLWKKILLLKNLMFTEVFSPFIKHDFKSNLNKITAVRLANCHQTLGNCSK